MREFEISEVKFTDSQGNEHSTNEDFKFSYSIGWMFVSNYPKCYQGTTLKMFKPNCELECGSEQCLLEVLEDHNNKRMLQPNAGPDVLDDVYLQPESLLPIRIPTETINLADSNVPDRLLQAYLNNYNMYNVQPSSLEVDRTAD